MKIPIVLAINDAYLNQAKVLLYSLYDNADTATVYDVYILHYRLQEVTKRALEQFYLENSFSGRITFLGLSDEQWQAIPFVGKWGKETNYRLFLATMLGDVDKIIYLDADVLVLDDLSAYYQINLGETAFASVTEDVMTFRRYTIFSKLAELDQKKIEYEDEWDYINAGILLFNLQKLREIDLQGKALKLLSLLPSHGKWQQYFHQPFVDPLVMPDQDILFYLAYAYTDGITRVPLFYNYLLFLFKNVEISGEADSEYRDYIAYLNRRVDPNIMRPEKPVMIHFAAMHPWKILHMKGDYAEKYHAYAKRIGWNTTKYSGLYFFAKVQNYIKHRLILPDFRRQMKQVFKKV